MNSIKTVASIIFIFFISFYFIHICDKLIFAQKSNAVPAIATAEHDESVCTHGNSYDCDEYLNLTDGIHILLQFYENQSEKTISETSSIQNAYSTDDKYIAFAFENELLDLYYLNSLTVPMRKHTVLSVLAKLIYRSDMDVISKDVINVGYVDCNLLYYSDIYGYVSALYSLGITDIENDDFDFYGIVTCSYLQSIIERTKNPSKRIIQSDEKERSECQKEFECVLQNSELPTGCEVTSLTAVLNHIGYDVDKCTLADNYLDKGVPGKSDFKEVFLGNPSYSGSYGCYAPVIVKCANKFLADNSSPYRAKDISGGNFSELLKLAKQGIPVIVWATIDMCPSYQSDVWQIGSKKLIWLANEHCLVIHGYDERKNTVLTADPLHGNIEYNADLFETRYNELLKQAVIIK